MSERLNPEQCNALMEAGMELVVMGHRHHAATKESLRVASSAPPVDPQDIVRLTARLALQNVCIKSARRNFNIGALLYVLGTGLLRRGTEGLREDEPT